MVKSLIVVFFLLQQDEVCKTKQPAPISALLSNEIYLGWAFLDADQPMATLFPATKLSKS